MKWLRLVKIKHVEGEESFQQRLPFLPARMPQRLVSAVLFKRLPLGLAPRLHAVGFQQVAAVGLGSGELGLQLVAYRHQFVHLSDDTVLLSEGRERDSISIRDSTSETQLLVLMHLASISICCFSVRASIRCMNKANRQLIQRSDVES